MGGRHKKEDIYIVRTSLYCSFYVGISGYIAFFQISRTRYVSRPEIVRGDQTWRWWFLILLISPRKRWNMFYRRWLVCLSDCLSVRLSVTTITKKIVGGFVPNFMGSFLGGKGRPSSYFVTIGRGMWK